MPASALHVITFLYGSEDWTTDYWQKLVNTYKIAPDPAHHLSAKFGTAAGNILDLVRVDASLGERIISEHPMIRAEVVYAVREELAATVEDVLARRVGVQFYSWRSAREAAPVVGAILGAELGWNDDQIQSAVNAYVSHINRLLDLAGLPRETSAKSLV